MLKEEPLETSWTFFSHVFLFLLGSATSGGFHISATKMEEVGESFVLKNMIKLRGDFSQK